MKLFAIVVFTSLCYVAWVFVWSMPDGESNNANQILGGCESKESVVRGDWDPVQKTVPPIIRCLVLSLKKEQVLDARFRYASVGKRDGTTRQGGTMTPMQFYVDEGWRLIGFTSSSKEVDAALGNVVLRSLDWLIENGADPNQCSLGGLVALHIAANHRRIDLFDKWIGLGAEPNVLCPDDGYRDVDVSPAEWRELAK